ncbi:hypothetical protein TVAG_265280 [Trichomonas vaginalis G3]|uniref:Uncharacterized protein n=1 Tax=Trichomonas vaginalis (strain ATCC PRA-98 / G3) TaxID=412133 RepID=A2G2M7_TRIV3|nr:hypothetical protein TVAGG3_0599520 [Trichomonas vaginalis G3]EAX88588.1 hypothetical protein TVAG_265280 [Trichomonas vaginalis G3]KAI5523836.1 hypothetical protein TVAGG3_0599520 [Trichomonas vaginalis G3]|eukprot:XP_001301518.1 hypothetical protein [Trichomonas vaginalis G3]
MPGPKGVYNNFICTILFSQSTPEELAESDFVNHSNISFLSNLRKTPLRNFVRAVTIRSARTGKALPKFLFEDDKLVNALLLSQNLEDLQQAAKASFQADKKYPDYFYATWSSIKDNVRTKMFNYIILPFASYFSQEALQFIINNGLKSLTKSFNFDLFIKTPECIQAANPRLIIEICMNKSDDTSFIASAAEVLNNISPEEFLEVLFTSPITAITATSQIFIQRLKKKNLSEEQISHFVDKFIFENEKVILSLLLEALKAGCTDVISESTFLNASNQIIEFPEFALDIIGLMSVQSDCTQFWMETETISILLDQLLCMKERSNLIQEFFDKFALEVNENTIIALLPMISQVPVVYSRFISICKSRFPEDNQVISEINSINVL